MSTYKRRPFMAGNTDVFVLSQPIISGTAHINADGIFPSVAALAGAFTLELSIQTETDSEDITFAHNSDLTLAGIVSAINAHVGANVLVLAEDFEGCLRIKSLNSGYVAGQVNQHAFIRILPNNSGGLTDASELFGFPVHPHPQATVTAGDLAASPVRPLTQINRPGASFIARGEDGTSQNLNRALHQLGVNEDSLHTRLKTRVAVPTVLDLLAGSNRLVVDNGKITGVNLSPDIGDDLASILDYKKR